MKFKEMLAYFAVKGSQPLLVITPILLALSILFIGCANLSETLSDSGQYDFRKARWGFSKERVMVTEQGKRIHLKKGNVIIYDHSIDDVKCKIVYCFKDNKLRAAGYITDKPVKRAQKIIKRSVDELGEPNKVLSDGMLWQTPKTLIYSNAYLSSVRIGGSKYQISGGILSHLLKPRAPAGHIRRWDGVWAYIDLDFYEALHGERFPLNELSFYEKQLFGVLKRRTIYTYYSGSGRFSIPR
jgi:hypothetical protein